MLDIEKMSSKSSQNLPAKPNWPSSKAGMQQKHANDLTENPGSSRLALQMSNEKFDDLG